MSTGDGPDSGDARDERSDRNDRGHRGERIGIGGGDDSVTRIQLAARWAEAYGPPSDSLGSVLKRFRAAYDYLDSVTHGVEPNDGDLDRELLSTRIVISPSGGSTSMPPPSEGTPSPPAAAPQPEPRAWG